MLGLISSIFSLVGSFLLAARLYYIMNNVRLALSMHEDLISKLIDLSNDAKAISFGFKGGNKPLEQFLSKKGLLLMVAGFLCLGLGALLKVVEILLAMK